MRDRVCSHHGPVHTATVSDVNVIAAEKQQPGSDCVKPDTFCMSEADVRIFQFRVCVFFSAAAGGGRTAAGGDTRTIMSHRRTEHPATHLRVVHVSQILLTR